VLFNLNLYEKMSEDKLIGFLVFPTVISELKKAGKI